MPSILNANNLAVFHIDTNSGDKPLTFATTSTTAADIGTAMAGTTPETATGFYFVQNSSTKKFTTAGTYNAANDTFTVVSPTLLAAATSSTLDISNEINDVARDAGQGGVIQEKDNSFSISAEGLVESIVTDTGRTLVDIANQGDYVIVKFTLDNTTSYVGKALIDSISITGSVDETATYSVTFAGVDSLLEAA